MNISVSNPSVVGLQDVSPATNGPALSGATIDRRTGLSQREFLHEYVLPGTPVILTDATARWPAMEKFTWAFFRERYGHLTKEIKGRTYSLRDVVDLIPGSTPEAPAPYPFNLNIETYFPELMADVRPDVPYGASDRVNHPLLPRKLMTSTVPYEVFFGGRGAAFPRVHYDALWLHTQITQIRGSKEFFLYPFEQGRFMYPQPDSEKTSQVDFTSPDFERFPLFSQARATVATVHEGESIFFPAGWWHATRIHEPCISVGRVHLNAGNWSQYTDDVHAYWRRYHAWIAPFVKTYLRALGPVISLQEKMR